MDNIDVGDIVQLNPTGLNNNACNIIWGHHNNNNGMGRVVGININQGGVVTAIVRTNNGAITALPIACLREHYAASGVKTKRKVKSKKRKSKKKKI